MKIEKVTLQNIQSHEKSIVRLSPNLNAIVGTTDSGKSSFLRGLIQLVTNKMKWNDLRRWDTESSKIIVTGDKKEVIKRIKEDKKNAYVVNGKELNTVRTDVPKKVFDALNLSEINIQHQKDNWFLIDKGPGVISKEINKVAGLSVMDRSLQAVNNAITGIKSRVRLDNNTILELDNSLEEFEYLPNADSALSTLEKLEEELDGIDYQIEFLEETLGEIEEEKTKLKKLLPEKIIKEIKALFKERDTINELDEEIEVIEELLEELTEYKKKLKNTKEIDVSDLIELKEELRNVDDEIRELDAILQNIAEEKQDYNNCKDELENTNKELRRIKVCPTCGNQYKHQKENR